MKIEDLLTNDFKLQFDEINERLLIYSTRDEKSSQYPIELQLKTLTDLGPKDACRFVGERILLLIPKMRSELFKIGDAEERKDH